MTAIEIVSGAGRWTAQIEDTAAGRDFVAQLPLELTLKDYAGTEKIADLPRPLTREGAPEGGRRDLLRALGQPRDLLSGRASFAWVDPAGPDRGPALHVSPQRGAP